MKKKAPRKKHGLASARTLADVKERLDAFKRDPDGEALRALKERRPADLLGRKLERPSVAEVERNLERDFRRDERYEKRVKKLSCGTYCAAA